MQGVDCADDRWLAELEASDPNLDPKFIRGLDSKPGRNSDEDPAPASYPSLDSLPERKLERSIASGSDTRFGILVCDLCRASLQLFDLAG
jgi:hypothetical protein